ncbi:MAG: DUF932 domain-containing protein [Planctomycetota bacterium]
MVTTNCESVIDGFDYQNITVSQIGVRKMDRSKTGRVTLETLEVNGRAVNPTKRFWRSFVTRFGIAENIFRYFEPEEVFQRIAQRRGDEGFRVCIERRPQEKADRLLAATSLNRPVIRYGEIRDLVKRYGGSHIEYNEGLLRSTHQPLGSNRQFTVGADQFQDRFTLETPIDGFGHPRLFLSLLRLVCENGAIGYSRAFRSDIPVGKNMDHCISRALQSFDNGDGYVALRQRFESAQTSWASVSECMELTRVMEKLSEGKHLRSRGLVSRSRFLGGNLAATYGLANLEALSEKRRRILPAKCRIYDLLNFASEVATHHATPAGNRRLQAYIGSLISDEYDLEGTADAVEFDAFFVPSNDGLPADSVN